MSPQICKGKLDLIHLQKNSDIMRYYHNASLAERTCSTSDSTKQKAELKPLCQLPICTMSDHFPDFTLLKKKGETFDYVSCFPVHLLSPLPACFTIEESTVKASWFVNSNHTWHCMKIHVQVCFSCTSFHKKFFGLRKVNVKFTLKHK